MGLPGRAGLDKPKGQAGVTWQEMLRSQKKTEPDRYPVRRGGGVPPKTLRLEVGKGARGASTSSPHQLLGPWLIPGAKGNSERCADFGGGGLSVCSGAFRSLARGLPGGRGCTRSLTCSLASAFRSPPPAPHPRSHGKMCFLKILVKTEREEGGRRAAAGS